MGVGAKMLVFVYRVNSENIYQKKALYNKWLTQCGYQPGDLGHPVFTQGVLK